MPRIKLTLAYDGTDYSGFQLQPRDRTVQGELERALGRIFDQPPRVHGSGRTDSGVHAMGQVAHFDCPDDKAHVPWQRSLNSLLPDDVCVLKAEVVDDDFHSRFSARGKVYEYVLWTKYEFCLPHRRRFVWDCGPVDFDAMEEAAQVLLGEHDFSAFQNVGTVVNSTVRTITEISRHPGVNEHEVVWRFKANSFLKQMVRNLMGCLVACGRGRLGPDDVRRILASKDRSEAPPTAPPQGLTLISVFYPDYL
ncbi:tRNA pseudouridine(38-40) synthase TruA [Pseudodesulfovibrio sp. zrk46]|uniref:tRNA pseudouridine(38-40) synthase TruA n=1 Tax=Pseudodesulfovibrio sp. zrk46 TaxID=2725288 RepID=UPI0014499750|nr:tRNA pseudouridine(38-40) synthase TruA [Pseudodesulfovibrio sp. zrk46]QJB55582.1 tRNA pseudouridine(38-40) synthase TruA [Pseudodesulfovibrio sp. zrk46]